MKDKEVMLQQFEVVNKDGEKPPEIKMAKDFGFVFNKVGASEFITLSDTIDNDISSIALGQFLSISNTTAGKIIRGVFKEDVQFLISFNISRKLLKINPLSCTEFLKCFMEIIGVEGLTIEKYDDVSLFVGDKYERWFYFASLTAFVCSIITSVKNDQRKKALRYLCFGSEIWGEYQSVLSDALRKQIRAISMAHTKHSRDPKQQAKKEIKEEYLDWQAMPENERKAKYKSTAKFASVMRDTHTDKKSGLPYFDSPTRIERWCTEWKKEQKNTHPA